MGLNMDTNYFRNKFKDIPDEQWTVGSFTDEFKENAFCALGHCGARKTMNDTDESRALNRLIWTKTLSGIADINDGKDKRFKQDTPKARILAALDFIDGKTS
jgi:hypothetical protein